MANQNNQYESVLILNTKAGDEAVQAMIEKFKALIGENGTLDGFEDWGRRRLAYEIQDETEGYYCLLTFTCGADFPAELDRIYKITDGVLRSLIIKKD